MVFDCPGCPTNLRNAIALVETNSILIPGDRQVFFERLWIRLLNFGEIVPRVPSPDDEGPLKPQDKSPTRIGDVATVEHSSVGVPDPLSDPSVSKDSTSSQKPSLAQELPNTREDIPTIVCPDTIPVALVKGYELPPSYWPTVNTVIVGGTGALPSIPRHPLGNERLVHLVLQYLKNYENTPYQSQKETLIRTVVHVINGRNHGPGFVGFDGPRWFQVTDDVATQKVRGLFVTMAQESAFQPPAHGDKAQRSHQNEVLQPMSPPPRFARLQYSPAVSATNKVGHPPASTFEGRSDTTERGPIINEEEHRKNKMAIAVAPVPKLPSRDHGGAQNVKRAAASSLNSEEPVPKQPRRRVESRPPAVVTRSPAVVTSPSGVVQASEAGTRERGQFPAKASNGVVPSKGVVTTTSRIRPDGSNSDHHRKASSSVGKEKFSTHPARAHLLAVRASEGQRPSPKRGATYVTAAVAVVHSDDGGGMVALGRDYHEHEQLYGRPSRSAPSRGDTTTATASSSADDADTELPPGWRIYGEGEEGDKLTVNNANAMMEDDDDEQEEEDDIVI